MDISSIFGFLVNLTIFLVGLSILVLVHEFGHFWAARRNGIKVEEFGLGFPPRLYSKKIGETIYSLNAFPIGGFVRLYGEDSSVEKDKDRSFFNKRKGVRTQVIVAGVLMNILLGIALFTGIYTSLGVPEKTQEKVVVTYIFPDSPAEQAHVKPFDRIVEINQEKIVNIDQVKEKSIQFAGQEIEIKVERSNLEFLVSSIFEKGNVETQAVRLSPRKEPPQGQGAMGIGLDFVPITQTKTYPFYFMPFKAAQAGIDQSFKFSFDVLKGLGRTVSDLTQKREVPKDVAGPIGIFQMTGTAAQSGIFTLLSFFAILSINLAVINIMPFPALDGGRLLFIVLEVLTGRRAFPKIERYAHSAGMIILLALIALITLSDINRFILGNF